MVDEDLRDLYVHIDVTDAELTANRRRLISSLPKNTGSGSGYSALLEKFKFRHAALWLSGASIAFAAAGILYFGYLPLGGMRFPEETRPQIVSDASSRNIGEEVVVGTVDLTEIGEPMVLNIGSRYRTYSEILAEERDLFIQLPAGYETSNASYDVIYITDGEFHFGHAVYATSLLQLRERMPESIIVGIPNMPQTRDRDLGSQQDRFMRFIKEEVIDFIDSNYRTQDYRTIFGHSAGANFVLNSLISDPQIFDNYIVAGPTVSEIQLRNFKLLIEGMAGQASPLSEKALYITSASEDSEGSEMSLELDELVDLLESRSLSNFNWYYDILPNQTHMTIPYVTVYEGIAFVFKNFQESRR